MRRLYRISTAVIAAACLTGMAMAAKFTPGGPSTAAGPVTITFLPPNGQSTINCRLLVRGTVANGIVKVTAAALSSSSFCARIVAQNLPWTITATTRTAARLDGIAFAAPFGSCLPTNNVPLAYSNGNNAFTVNQAPLNGGCRITGQLVTSNNALTIIN